MTRFVGLPSRQAIRWLVAAAMFAVPVSTGVVSASAPGVAPCGTWTIVPSPPSGTPTAYLAGVGGNGGNDIWAVGHQADYSDVSWHGLLRHWNGRSWTAAPAPQTPPGNGRFYAVATLSRTDAWAVGEGPVIAHWNGTRWRLVSSPRVTPDDREPARLLGIAAVAANDVWAVGLNWHYPTEQLIEHWNGRRWRVIPGVPGGRHPLQAIAALSADNIWAMGDGVEHWNGSKWTLASASVSGSAIAAVSASDIWIAGDDTIRHWNGSTWSVVPSPGSGEQFTMLTGITALSASDIWAAGFTGHTIPHDGYAEHPFVLHWDGSAWRIVPTPATGSPDSQLLAVTSVSPGTVWAVGFAGLHRAGKVHALIERYDRC